MNAPDWHALHHADAALAITRQLNIVPNGGRALTGRQLAALDDAALASTVREVDVFARAEPEQKLRLVRALQANGEIVAGATLPITPLQILWVNMTTAVLLGLPLAGTAAVARLALLESLGLGRRAVDAAVAARPHLSADFPAAIWHGGLRLAGLTGNRGGRAGGAAGD